MSDRLTNAQSLILVSLAVLLYVSSTITIAPLGGFNFVWQAINTPFSQASLEQLLVSQSWLPRLVISLLAGLGLALAGELLQLLLRNPLASDTTLGVSSGASLAIMLATLFAPQLLSYGIQWVAMLGAAITLFLVFAFGWQYSFSPMILIIIGMTLNLLMGSLALLLLLFNHESLSGLLIWGAGSLAQQGWHGAYAICISILLGLIFLILILRPLKLMALDDASLRNLGVAVNLIRFCGLSLAVYLTASIVSYVGVIGFVGLAAPNIMRLTGSFQFQRRLPLSMLFGALILAVADQTLQVFNLWANTFIPTGASTALLGAPLLLWLIWRLSLNESTGIITTTREHIKTRHAKDLFWPTISLAILVLIAVSVGQLSGQWHWATPFSQHSLQWRMPRIIAAICSGVLLAFAGTILQRMTANPMASPELMGVSSSSAIGLLLGVFFLPNPDYFGLACMAIFGACIALAVIFLFNRRNLFSSQGILLTGIAIGALYEALKDLLLAGGDPRGQQLTAWLSGSTYYVDFYGSLVLLGLTVLLIPLVLFLHRWLDIFSLGVVTTHSLGIPLKSARFILLFLAAILSALATIIIGPLSFIGLVAPHMARMFGFRHAFLQLIAAALIGSFIMLFADWFGRVIMFPYEVPAGIIASIIGGGYFLCKIWHK